MKDRVRDAVSHSGGVVTWLTVYVVLLYGVPSRLVVGPLASAGAPSMLMGLASALLWVLVQIWRPPTTSRAAQPVKWALGVFLFCVGVSYVAAMVRPIDLDEISPADVALLAAVSWSGTLLVAHDGLRTRAAVETLLRRFVVVGSLMALLGLAQFLTRDPLIASMTIPGLTARGEAGVFLRDGMTRVAGTATHPIEFGALLTILLPLSLHSSFHGESRGPVRRWLPTVIIAAALAVSLSRTVYVGIAVALAVLFLGWPNRVRLRVLGALLMALAVTFAVYPRLVTSIATLFSNSSEDPSIASRTSSYSVAATFIGRSPLFGRGLGTFLPKYRIFDNQYLGLLVALGVVGTAAFVGLLAVAVVALVRCLRMTDDPGLRDLALSLVASITVGAVTLAMFDAFSFPMTAGTLFLCLGLGGATARLGRRSRRPAQSPGAELLAAP